MAPKSAEIKGLEANFAEIHPPMNAGEASIEAGRCLYCYDAPCIQACPTHIEVPRYIKQIHSKDLTGAAKTILEANPMGHSCARVCPVEVLCEGACVYVAWHEKPIEIANLQRVVTDHFYKGSGQITPLPQGEGRPALSEVEGVRATQPLFKPGKPTGKKVAVVGAGPAGLSCAFYLARLGHAVTIFDRKSLPGGLNSYGIAEYKMTQRTALEEVALVKSLGVRFETGVEVGSDVSLKTLEKDCDAVFIGIGLGGTHQLGVPGEDLDGVWDALSFIERVKTRKFRSIDVGRSVVVIGAGNTAVDAVTQAKRLGAARVIMAYRRGPEQASAYDYEMELARQDEIEFLWNAAPIEILGISRKTPSPGLRPPSPSGRGQGEGDKVGAIRMVRTRTGKKGLERLPGSEFILNCDRVITAIGQSKMADFLKTIPGLTLSPNGTPVVDPGTMRTTNPKFYAGGDAVNGGKEVVNAAADGKRAAWGIHRALTGAKTPAPEHAYWVSTIDGRKVAPIPDRGKGQGAGVKPVRKQGTLTLAP